MLTDLHHALRLPIATDVYDLIVLVLWVAWLSSLLTWQLAVRSYRRRVVHALRYYSDLLGPQTDGGNAARAFADKLETRR